MRLSAVTTALTAGALILGVLPAALAAPATAPSDPSSAPVVEAVPWEPGELDIDWAAFANENRDEYETSAYAAAADAEAADVEAREAARDAIRAEYLQESGAEGSTYADVSQARTGALAQQYYDECDDGTNLPQGGVQANRNLLYRGGFDGPGSVSYNPEPAAPPPLIDLRSMFVLQSTDDLGRFDQTAFLVYACQEWANSALGAGGITFGLYVTFEDGENEYPTVLGDPEIGPDFIVSIFPEPTIPERPLQIMAVRTPSRDSSTWTITYLDEAQRLDNYEIDGVVPTSAIGDFTADSGFAWTVEVVDTQQPQGGRDWFPERNYLARAGSGDDEETGTHIPQFPVPDGCGLQEEQGIRYVLEPQAVTPNDDGYPVQWYHPQIDTPEAWDTIRDSSVGGRSRPVTVAVIDSGIDSTRFDFLAGGARVVAGLDAQYALELEGGDNGGAIGPFIGPSAVTYDTFGATSPPRNSDRGPHGTAVASLIGATGNNTIGIAGVDWGVRLMPIRVNDVNNCISNIVVAEGVKWAVDHGADIINISLAASETDLFTPDDAEEDVPECRNGRDDDRDGTTDYQPEAGESPDFGCDSADDGSEGVDATDGGDGGTDPTPACSDGRDNDNDGVFDASGNGNIGDSDCSSPEDNFEGNDGESEGFDPLREVIDYALEQGVVVVTAAGNFGADDDPVVYPAAYPGVISVGANDRWGERSFYSSTGRWLDLVAPGGNNSGSLSRDVAVLWELDRIRPAAGTSFAAPLVAGAASLYLGLNPHITRGFTPSATPPDPAVNFPDTGYQRTVDDVKIALQNGVRDIAPTSHDIFTGWGRLNVDRVLDVPAVGGPLVDPARLQLPRTNADSVSEVVEGVALSRPLVFPPFVVLTRSDVAVDALAGAALLREGPLLVATQDGISDSTMDVINQLMPDGGKVYVLGGEAALGSDIDEQLESAGHTVARLAGATRIDTALAIAEEVRTLWPDSGTVGLVRSDGGNNPTAQWADALSGGAWAAETGTPILVTGSDVLHPDVADALSRWGTTETVLFGGTAALSSAIESAVPGPVRIGGADRAETAANVAEQLWDDVDGYMLANGYYARGWPAGLAAAGWAADVDAPLLYTGPDSVPPATADVLGRTCPDIDALQIVGGASLVTGTAETALMEAATCG